MDTKITEIEILLDKLNLLFGSIKNDGQIDKLEMELLKRYVQQLHDKVQTFEVQKVQSVVEHPIIQQVIKQEEPPVQQVIQPKIEEEKKEEIKIPIVEPKAEPIIEKVNVVIPPVEIPPVIVEQALPETKEQPVVKQEAKKKLIAQVDEEEEEDFNTGLNNKHFKDKKTLADKISSSKEKDLKNVIHLNEKLFFISKLFKGDKDAYEQSIKTLNAFSNFQEADRFIINDLKVKLQWQDEDAIERLKEVVRAKFE